MKIPNNLLREPIAALRGTRFLAYPSDMSRHSVPCALHSARSQRFFEIFTASLNQPSGSKNAI